MTLSTAAEQGEPITVSRPTLQAVVRAPDDEGVEQLLRSTRAEIAHLSLRLRAVSRKADIAEQAADSFDATASESFDVAAARELLESSLRQRLDIRATRSPRSWRRPGPRPSA
jgi:hypothetical protein